MNCDGVKGLLSAYLDGELSPGELLRVEQHLRRCHWCADEVDSLRQSIALVSSLDEVELPVGFHAALHDRLVAVGPSVMPLRSVSALPTRSRSTRRWTIPAAAAAAAAALAIGLTSYGGVKNLPGLEAPAGQFAVPSVPTSGGSVAMNTTPPQGNDTPSSTTAPAQSTQTGTTATGTGTVKTNTGTKSNSNTGTAGTTANPNTQAGSGTAPIGEPVYSPGQGQIASGNPSQPATTTEQLTPKLHYSAVLTASAESQAQVKALAAQYNGVIVDDTLTIQVPTDKFAEALKAVAAQLGVAPVQPVSEDLASQIQLETQALQSSTASLDTFQKEYNNMSTAEKATADPQLAQLKQQVEVYQRNVDSLNQSLQRSTITVKLQPASR